MDVKNIGEGTISADSPWGFRLDIRSHGFDLTDALRQYAIDHLAAKLAKHAAAIHEVIIRFEDVNGDKGGADKRCRIEVHLVHNDRIVVEDTAQDLRAAIDSVADRAEMTVGRDLQRRRAIPRQRGRKLVRTRKTLS